MTSKKSSANLTLFTFKEALKSSALAPAAILFAGLMLFIVVMGSSSLFQVYQLDDGTFEKNSVNFKYLLFEMPEMYATALPILIAGAGGLMAVTLFRFITSKKTVNVYYSLGIKREKLFIGRYMAGALLLFVSIAVPFTIMFFVNVFACGYSKELLTAFLYITLTLLSIVFTAFSLTSAVFGAVGTAFETSVFSGILLFSPTIVFYALQTVMQVFLYGNPYGSQFVYSNDSSYSVPSEALTEKFNFLNPVFFNRKDLALFSVMDKTGKMNIRMEGDNLINGSPDFIVPLMWMLIASALLGLGIIIFKKRKAEICGFIGMNKYLNAVTVFIAAFFVFCFIINIVPFETIAKVLIAGVVFAVIYIALELLILRDTKKFKKGLYKLPIGLIICGITVGIFATGLFGFSNKMPDKSEIKEAAITFGGVNDEFAYGAQDSWYESDGINFVSSGLIVDGFKSDKDIEAVMDIHKYIANESDGEKTDGTIKIVYTLKDGSNFIRSFSEVPRGVYKKLVALEKSDNYKNRLYEVFKGDINEPGEKTTGDKAKLYIIQSALRTDRGIIGVYSKYLNKTADLNLTRENRERLVNCLYSDLLKRSVDEKYYPEETPIMYITFECNDFGYHNGSFYVYTDDVAVEDGEIPEGEIVYSDSMDVSFFNLCEWSDRGTIAVTSDMKSTVNFLKELGVYEAMTALPEYETAEIIPCEDYEPRYSYGDKSILFRSGYMSREYFDSVSMEGATFSGSKTISDKETVKTLAENAFSTYMLDEKTGYFVALFTKDKETVTTMYIPEEALDDEIKLLIN